VGDSWRGVGREWAWGVEGNKMRATRRRPHLPAQDSMLILLTKHIMAVRFRRTAPDGDHALMSHRAPSPRNGDCSGTVPAQICTAVHAKDINVIALNYCIDQAVAGCER